MFSNLLDELLGRQASITVVGLGYVGLPLAVALASRFKVAGFDVNRERVRRLNEGLDDTGEVDRDRLAAAKITVSDDPAVIAQARFIIVPVPTPIDAQKTPDLGPLTAACEIIGRNMARGGVVVFESTVYPGVTDDILTPLLERESGFSSGVDFLVGYSPERINPGDKSHTVESVVKIVSGQDERTLDIVAGVYGAVIDAGVHRAPSIKTAEAAKVIENIQRDLNIALMNELAMIFNLVGVDTRDVLAAAGTKWNFLAFEPGLVGGHCIGVDPYYLTTKAEELGYHPQVILAGRRINDGMGKYVAEKTVKLLIRAGVTINQARVGVMGLTFKENVPDIRNSRVTDIIEALRGYEIDVLVHDPLADAKAAREQSGVTLCGYDDLHDLDGVIVAVGHSEYIERGATAVRAMLSARGGVVADVKALFGSGLFGGGVHYWRL